MAELLLVMVGSTLTLFDFQDWIEVFRTHYREYNVAYNDTVDMTSFDDPSYQIIIEKLQNPIWRILGIHHLLPDENRGNHNIYVEMLCKQGDREHFRTIHWTWIGRQLNEPARDVHAGDKPLNELVDLPLNLGMIVSVWTNGSEVAKGLSSNYPDETDGNSVGHHSFFVCFEEIDLDNPDPDPEPPEQETVMLIKKSWLDNQELDSDGFIRIIK